MNQTIDFISCCLHSLPVTYRKTNINGSDLALPPLTLNTLADHTRPLGFIFHLSAIATLSSGYGIRLTFSTEARLLCISFLPSVMAVAESIPVAGATASGCFTSRPSAADPYSYQVGFGNRFATEALAGVLPDLGWDKFPLPSNTLEVDFVDGLKTIAGHGDPTAKEGLAVHVYLANTSMKKRAFCNNDGDMLILPQEGRLDIQTEFGRLMVRPGELAVIQAGMKFTVRLPDGVGRGYIQEIFGSHYELPELGPVGSNGMAMPRDFEIPVASFDVDQSPWTVVVKLIGQHFTYEQNHTPFDVVAWHGNYTPYKYALEKFINNATVERDQSDPSIYCVLTAKSKIPGVSLSDFLIFTPKWQVTSNTFRLPYYHRNVATEIMGMMYGRWALTSHLEPGGLTYEPSYMPHGESYKLFKEATTAALVSQRAAEESMAFMMHISGHVSLTKYALERCGNLQPVSEDLWDDFQPGFLNHLDDVVRGGDQAPQANGVLKKLP
ncbi:hypothetical protein DL546_007173 [Coniochaeta pulveracea]|uniref:homogentisate 1,2-dioxygenase n=1 Tax=Coniochaeta pulveracea TaxID=177199 RepID=A0A420YLV7_9PEZI|nr:hypothetical protein DL546_007173 [Coniochaeta pulveracea]